MKIRKLFSGFLICLFLLSAAVPAAAVNGRLYDEAGCLNDDQKIETEDFLQTLSRDCACEFAVVTLRKLNGETAEEAADRYSDMLLGDGGDKVLLLYAEKDRTVTFSLNGRGHAALSRVSDDLLDTFVDVFQRNGFFEAMMACLRESSQRFSLLKEEDLPSGNETLSQKNQILISAGIGLAAALIVTLVMKGKLKSVRQQSSAGLYRVENSLNFTRCDDIFLYTTVTKVRRQTSDSGSSGRSSSSGHSTNSRHF